MPRVLTRGVSLINGFDSDVLQFWPTPGKNNHKMQTQQGAFLYDTLEYAQERGIIDLEDFIENIVEPPEIDVTLTKLYFKTSWVEDIFEKLEMMGITGSALFRDEAGAVMDVKNTYFYNPKSIYFRDNPIPPNDIIKICGLERPDNS